MNDPVVAGTTEPASYWHGTYAPLVPNDPLPKMADVVVIGGGLLGVWSTYWLARAGVPVTLLEKQVISWGATGRNGGFLVGGTAQSFASLVDRIGVEDATSLERLVQDGMSLAVETIRGEGIECDFRTPGVLSLALDSGSFAEAQRSQKMLANAGFAADVLDREGLAEHIYTPLGEDVVGGTYVANGHLVHSSKYLCGLAEAARRHGAKLVRAQALDLTRDGDVTRIRTDVGDVLAGRVVVALNAWTDSLVPTLAGTIVPVRGQILSYAPTRRVFDAAIGTAVTPTGEYWQQTPDGSIVIGGNRAGAPNADVNVREMVPTDEVIAGIEAVLPRLFPQLSDLRVARRWAGLMAFTGDYLPVADAVPDLPGVFVTGGYCGHGMPFGPRVGQLLAQAAMQDEVPRDLHALRINRPTLGKLAPA